MKICNAIYTKEEEYPLKKDFADADPRYKYCDAEIIKIFVY